MRLILLTAIFVAGCSSSSANLEVPTAECAHSVVIEHLLGNEGIKAEHGFAVSPLVRLAEDTERFGSVGTPYWEVRRTDLHDGFNIDGLFWVNAVTGEVLQLHPPMLDNGS